MPLPLRKLLISLPLESISSSSCWPPLCLSWFQGNDTTQQTCPFHLPVFPGWSSSSLTFPRCSLPPGPHAVSPQMLCWAQVSPQTQNGGAVLKKRAELHGGSRNGVHDIKDCVIGTGPSTQPKSSPLPGWAGGGPGSPWSPLVGATT